MSIGFSVIRDGVASSRDVPEVFRFPGGEWNLCDIPSFDEDVTWVALVRGADANDLLVAGLLTDLANQRMQDGWVDGVVLLIPYLPAARADRGRPLGARVYANFINHLEANRVVTLDAHSQVMPNMVERCTNLPAVDLIEQALDRTGKRYDAVIAPDKGAVERVAAVAERLGVEMYTVDKNRDFDTGRIVAMKVPPMPASGRYLVVDDICDGGGTFKMLAGYLGRARTQLGLWVTHGIFSGLSIHLPEHFADIFTTDSHPGHGRVGVANCITPVWPLMMDHARGAL